MQKKNSPPKAIFQIDQEKASGFNLSGEFGALASLAGLSNNATSSTEALLERLKGREFILVTSKKSLMTEDPYFNTFKPGFKDPLWKAMIKRIIGFQETEAKEKTIIENKIIDNYRANIEFYVIGGGAMVISVTHTSPKSASEYANTIMKEIQLLIEEENRAAQDLRLSYLSETLADALQDMEAAQSKLKDYTLKNSAMAQENFISGSLKLDGIRMERKKVEEISELLSILEDLIKTGDLDDETYTAIRSNYPLVDDIDFRRILGMSETISAWTWPKIETLKAVNTTLKDRIRRLDINIKEIEENAKIYASSAEDLEKFTRSAKIAEATYTVLIEQVKSQSLAAGFQPETFKVFEYATPPLSPSSPNRNRSLALGGLLGLVIGSALALINSLSRGVYYTRTSLISEVGAKLTIKSKPIKKLAGNSILNIKSAISKNSILEVNEAEIKLANKKIIYIFSLAGRLNASDTARILATKSSESGRKIVICDTTGKSENEISDKFSKNESRSSIINVSNNINVVTKVQGSAFFSSSDFEAKLKDLTNQFDQVFICSSSDTAKSGLMALEDFSPSCVLTASLRKTRKIDIREIISTQSIDILFYD